VIDVVPADLYRRDGATDVWIVEDAVEDR